MSKGQISRCLVILLFCLMVAILNLNPSMGQVQFDEPVNVSQTRAVNWSSEIVAAGDQVLVYWNDYTSSTHVLAAHSSDRGVTFRNWNLSAEIPRSWPPAAAADEENVYVAWLGFPDLSDLFTTGLFLSRSNDRGESFLPPFDITGRGGGGEANLRIQNGILNIAWEGKDRRIECCSYYKSIYFAKSHDLGQTFTKPVQASSNPIGGEWGIASVPELVLDGNQVYVAWLGGRPGLRDVEVYFARSTDGGKSFDKTISLSNLTEFLETTNFLKLALGGRGYVYAAWGQGLYEPSSFLDIYFSRSMDGGKTFSKPVNLSNNPQANNVTTHMVAAGDNVYIVWAASGAILFSRSTDSGQTFSEPAYISRAGFMPQIAVVEKGMLLDYGITDHIVYLVWENVSDRYTAISFSVSLDGGMTFSSPQRISNGGRHSALPRIATVGSNIYVTWRQDPYDSDAMFIRGQLELPSKTPNLESSFDIDKK